MTNSRLNGGEAGRTVAFSFAEENCNIYELKTCSERTIVNTTCFVVMSGSSVERPV